MVVRGVVTALSWAGLPMHGFALGAHEQASDWLGLSPIERQQVRQELPRLGDQVSAAAALHVAS